MKYPRLSLLLITMLPFLIMGNNGCGGGGGNYSSESSTQDVTTDAEAPKDMMAPTANQKVPEDKTKSIKNARMIIRRADMKMSVDDYAVAVKKINALIKKTDSYLGNANETNDDYRREGVFTIRCAADQFDTTLEELEAIGERVDYKNVDADDVTEEYTDVSIRLNAKKESEKRYIDLLRQAKTIDEILKLENNIRVIHEEIESAEGRLRYLSDRVSYSTITVTIYKTSNYIPEPKAGFFARMGRSLVGGWNGILEVIIGLFSVWPLWIILGGLGFFVRKYMKEKKEQQNP